VFGIDKVDELAYSVVNWLLFLEESLAAICFHIYMYICMSNIARGEADGLFKW